MLRQSAELLHKFVPVGLILFIRILGGLAGAGPALIALAMLDRGQYGLAAANIATALLLAGPITQFLNQGYIRSLMEAHARGERLRGPIGTCMIYAYVVVALIVLTVLGTTGVIQSGRAVVIGIILASVLVLKVFEVYFLSRKRKISSVILFYVLPPIGQCLLMIALHFTHAFDSYTTTLWAYISALWVAIIVVLFKDWLSVKLLFVFRIPQSFKDMKAECGTATLFFTNGMLLSASEQVPTILFKYFGLTFAIPTFEIMKKIMMVPSVMVHAFGMHFNPELIAHIHNKDFAAFRSTLKAYLTVSALFGIIYVGFVPLASLVFRDVVSFLKDLDIGGYWPLLASSLITTMFSPIGAAAVALKSDRWWLIGASFGFTVLLLVSFLGRPYDGQFGIILAILAQNLALSLCMAFGMVKGYQLATKRVNLATRS